MPDRPDRPVGTIGAQIPTEHTRPKPGPKRKRPRGAGRDITLTPEIAKLVCDARARGVNWTDCAHFAEVNPGTLQQWRDKAAAGKEPYATLLADADRADARGVVMLADEITKAARKDWRAAAWLLERRRPEEFSARAMDRVEISGEVSVREVDPARTAIYEALVREKMARIEARRRLRDGVTTEEAPTDAPTE